MVSGGKIIDICQWSCTVYVTEINLCNIELQSASI